MRRLSLLIVVMLTLISLVALGGSPRTAAQDEATPTDDVLTVEGITYDLLALGSEEHSGLGLVRITFEPGSGVPVEANDPAVALVYIEAGTLTVQLEGPIRVTRAGAFDVFLAPPTA